VGLSQLDLDALCYLVEVIIGISTADWEGDQKVHSKVELKKNGLFCILHQRYNHFHSMQLYDRCPFLGKLYIKCACHMFAAHPFCTEPWKLCISFLAILLVALQVKKFGGLWQAYVKCENETS